MKRFAPVALTAIGAVLLLWNLGRPALWQDEAETALRAESILESGLPRMTLRGVLVTAQPSLAKAEGNAAGVWTWNTWLPAYLTAASFAVLGPTPFAARLPFALAGILTLWLSFGLFESEEALALLALSPAFLLFCRQSRYYALVALGTVLVLRSWRRLLENRPYGALAVALSLQFLLHSSFAFFVAAAAALALDAVLRRDECPRARRFWVAVGLTVALAAPAVWYFRVWDRPGNHLYSWLESVEFLKTFFLWIAAFAAPLALFAAASFRRWALCAAGFVLLCGLAGEGPWSLACAAAAWCGLLALAAAEPAPPGAMNLKRICLLLIAATLGLLAFGAAEPYGRYLAGILPAVAYLTALALSDLGRGKRAAVAALTALAVSCNFFYEVPLKAAQALTTAEPQASVSGMMRQRLRDLPLRSDLARFVAATWSGGDGYVEAAAGAMRAGGGETFFSDADELSLMFAAPGFRPVYPEEFKTAEPDWILPSPWLSLQPDVAERVRVLATSGRYEAVLVEAPRLLWQNNPDPLFRDFAPKRGPLPLFHRRAKK